MTIAELDESHVGPLIAFFAELPEGDRTLIKEDLGDAAAIRSWPGRPGRRWVAVEDGVLTGYVAALPLTGLSDHVAELRLVVHPAHRRAGVGRALARHALTEAVRSGRRKVVVELAADQEHALGMFGALGFTGEALLRDHIRDRDGHLHDLVMLAHLVDDTWAGMATLGLADELPG
jgi:ribosomal protein S18 acetylase RimI-like enzyme